ncbi:MAG TPA: 6-phosphogluconolactonase [Acidimicrobiales bacterium]|nr:6-phosphogluconolactonase [Acidimicrobiales bacterium]
MNGQVDLVPSVPDAFASLVVDSLAERRTLRFSLFLSGGSIAQSCYLRLAELTAGRGGAGGSGGTGADTSDGTDWSSVDVYLGDERCVPPDHPDSNHRMITETLLDAVGPVGSDHPMYRSGPAEQAALAYQEEIASLPTFDLIHLGLGPDGHCASLFPGSPALAIEDPSILVVANRDPMANNPHNRITLTYPGIARARLVVFTVSGSSKREAFSRIVAGVDLPAARVTAERVIWLVDGDAAGNERPAPA